MRTVNVSMGEALVLVAVAVGMIGCFAWWYYKEWRIRRDFRRFLERKSRGPGE